MKIFSLLMLPCLLLPFPCSSLVAVAQTAAPIAPVWTMQDSGVTASLRGIWVLDSLTAWASGSEGTVLRTDDGGKHWIHCKIPDEDKDGITLDFRGLRAWEPEMAIVMASGPGDKSRLYKTSDGCRTWKLIFRNPDKDGFWDAMKFYGLKQGMIVGDPVNGKFTLFYTHNGGKSWTRMTNEGLEAKADKQGAFAASNTSLFLGRPFLFVTGGKDGASIYIESETKICVDCDGKDEFNMRRKYQWTQYTIPIGNQTDGSGAFSVDGRYENQFPYKYTYVTVGGDYTKPNESVNTAAWSSDGGKTWIASQKPPHGYRSAVQWSDYLQVWIAVGTNGSDYSRDDGKTWIPLDDGNWNAISPPYIVGPNGRIGRLNEKAIPPVNPQPSIPAR